MIERTFDSNCAYLSINEMVGCADIVLISLLISNGNKMLTFRILLCIIFFIVLEIVVNFCWNGNPAYLVGNRHPFTKEFSHSKNIQAVLRIIKPEFKKHILGGSTL